MLNIIFSAAFFGLGLYELLEDRRQGQALTFGQIVPLALLSLPFLSALEASCGAFCVRNYLLTTTEERKEIENEELAPPQHNISHTGENGGQSPQDEEKRVNSQSAVPKELDTVQNTEQARFHPPFGDSNSRWSLTDSAMRKVSSRVMHPVALSK
jgi:hypothetical protein